MGQLLEQSIKTLFQGVSRQPHSVRLPGQVQEANNAIFSVVTGGFSKRPGSEQVKALTGIGSSDLFSTHTYRRDEAEHYFIAVGNGWIKVYDNQGNAKTVATPDGVSYLAAADPETAFRFVTIADYTFIANREVTVAMDAAIPPSNNPHGLIRFRACYGVAGWTVKIKRGASSWTAVYNPGTGTTRDDTVATNMKSAIDALGIANFTTTLYHDTIYCVSTNGVDFEMEAFDRDGAVSVQILKDYVDSTEFLPREAPANFTIGITSDVQDEEDTFYLKYAGLQDGWVETVKPGIPTTFTDTTMPHELIRETDGTFTFKKATWGTRDVGDEQVVPDPEFVGQKIQDISHHRSRLVLIANETAFFSQIGDFYDFWPDSAGQVYDTDPLGRTSPERDINVLRYAESFRKVLFVTSDRAQFEISADNALTPRNARIDLSTKYAIEERCRPFALGDELYLGASSGERAVVFEYYYDDSSLSNTAADVTIHTANYVPSPLVRISGDSVTDHLFFLSDSARDTLFTYRLYWNQQDKAQAAWGKWVFADSYIHDAFFVGDFLWVLVRRSDNVTYLEKISLDETRNADKHTPYAVRLDQRTLVTGSYDSGTDKTTWTLPYGHNNDIVVLLSSDFGSLSEGRSMIITYESTTSVSASGDFSAGEAIIGRAYETRVELSKQFPREGDGKTITGGRLQLRDMFFDYTDSGYFEVHVTPQSRPTRVYKWTGRILGSILNKVGGPVALDRGTFPAKIRSRGDTVRIEVVSSSHIPMTITSAHWRGFFNELTRQE